MFFRVGGQFSCPCFFRRLSFPLGSFLVWFSWTDHIHVGSFLGSLFSPGVHVSVFLPVPHCGGYYRAVLQFEVGEEDASSCVLLSQSSWPFKVLFNISSLLVGVFLFLWKREFNIILWFQSVYLLMALFAMDILIPHCSSAWAWNSFLVICLFFGFFISAF